MNEPIQIKLKRNLFEVENARNLSIQELVETFIPTQSFWRLLSAKHHVVLGARGQGKTALAKMLSHDHLSLMAELGNDPRAQTAICDQKFIGIYLPTRLEWVGGLKNKPWLDEREREELFQWRLNIASCIAFLPIVKSCISNYVVGKAIQAETEKKITRILATDWIVDDGGNIDDLLKLRIHLEDTDFRKQIEILRTRATGKKPMDNNLIGLVFAMELFSPLRQGIKQLSRLISINEECVWLVLLDEAEFLDKMDHRVINSHMRAYPDKLFLKMTTMPYHHFTLETNIGPPLVNGQDFEYVNLDSDHVLTAKTPGEVDTIGTQFGRTLFKNILRASDKKRFSDERLIPQIDDILGPTPMLDPLNENWDLNSDNMKLLEKYGSVKTVNRAKELVGKPEFRSQISRKIQGVLFLRKEVDECQGNKSLEVYSGARMAIRCADNNPRHLIRIFNSIILMQQPKARRKRINTNTYTSGFVVDMIQPSLQTMALTSLSTSTLNQIRSFPEVGPDLHKFITMVGEYMYRELHLKPLTTDQISSIKIDDGITEEEWKLVQVAIGNGLLHINYSYGNIDEMPWKTGTYHLSYSLAPHFLLFPRRGKSVTLTSIKNSLNKKEESLLKFEENQLNLFEKGDAI